MVIAKMGSRITYMTQLANFERAGLFFIEHTERFGEDGFAGSSTLNVFSDVVNERFKVDGFSAFVQVCFNLELRWVQSVSSKCLFVKSPMLFIIF